MKFTENVKLILILIPYFTCIICLGQDIPLPNLVISAEENEGEPSCGYLYLDEYTLEIAIDIQVNGPISQNDSIFLRISAGGLNIGSSPNLINQPFLDISPSSINPSNNTALFNSSFFVNLNPNGATNANGISFINYDLFMIRNNINFHMDEMSNLICYFGNNTNNESKLGLRRDNIEITVNNGFINFNYNLGEDLNINVDLYNLQGELVKRNLINHLLQKRDSKFKAKLPYLNSGLYFLHFSSKNEEKVIKYFKY